MKTGCTITRIDGGNYMNAYVGMTTSSNGNIFRVASDLSGEFPLQRPVTQSFDVFFDLRPN